MAGTSRKRLKAKLRGWIAYFRLAEVKGIFEDLDGWIRRKLPTFCDGGGSAPSPEPGI